MNFFWRQNIVGLLRLAAERVPEISLRCQEASRNLDRTLTSPYLDEAFALFQDAALRTRDPVYVTGAFYTMRAIEEVSRWEAQAGGPVRLSSAADPTYLLPLGGGAHMGPEGATEDERAEDLNISNEVDRGIMELFERIVAGASLDEALALFPQVGDEHSPD